MLSIILANVGIHRWPVNSRTNEEGTERTSSSAICLQDRRGHPLQQWPVSRHFRCDASCSTVPDLWTPRATPVGFAHRKNVILVLWLLFLYWTGIALDLRKLLVLYDYDCVKRVGFGFECFFCINFRVLYFVLMLCCLVCCGSSAAT